MIAEDVAHERLMAGTLCLASILVGLAVTLVILWVMRRRERHLKAQAEQVTERARHQTSHQATARHRLIQFIDQVRNPPWPAPSVAQPHIECGSANYFTATDGYHGNPYLVVDGARKHIGLGHDEWVIALEVLGELVDPWHGLNPPSVKQGTFTILDTEDKIREVGMWPLDWDNR